LTAAWLTFGGGGLVLGVGAALEWAWYRLFRSGSTRSQRWSALGLQLLRLAMMLAALWWVWHGLNDTPQGFEGWRGQAWGFAILFAGGWLSLSRFLDMRQRETLAQRAESIARYEHRLPFDVRWYLRRTTTLNAVVFAYAAAKASAMPSGEIDDGGAVFSVLTPGVTGFLVLTIFRRVAHVWEPPEWSGPIDYTRDAPAPPPAPGQPDPGDVADALHRPRPRRKR